MTKPLMHESNLEDSSDIKYSIVLICQLLVREELYLEKLQFPDRHKRWVLCMGYCDGDLGKVKSWKVGGEGLLRRKGVVEKLWWLVRRTPVIFERNSIELTLTSSWVLECVFRCDVFLPCLLMICPSNRYYYCIVLRRRCISKRSAEAGFYNSLYLVEDPDHWIRFRLEWFKYWNKASNGVGQTLVLLIHMQTLKVTQLFSTSAHDVNQNHPKCKDLWDFKKGHYYCLTKASLLAHAFKYRFSTGDNCFKKLWNFGNVT